MPTSATPIECPEQWHAMRARNVGASEVASLIGVHPYQTALGLWALKSGKTPPVTENSAMRRGKKLEPVAIEMIRDEFPTWKLSTPALYYEDPSIRLGATPDLLATAPEPHGLGVVQIKCVEPGVFKRNWYDEHNEFRPPLWVAVQTITEAHLVGAQWGAVAALVIGHGIELHVIDVPLHPGVVQRVRDETALFWQRIAKNNPPDPDYGRDGALLAALFRQDDGGKIDLAGDNELPGILERRERATEARKHGEAEVKTCDAMIMHKLGTAAVGTFNGGYVSARTVNRKAYEVASSSYRQVRIVRKEQAA